MIAGRHEEGEGNNVWANLMRDSTARLLVDSQMRFHRFLVPSQAKVEAGGH